MGVIHVLEFVQMLPNCTKHLIYTLTNRISFCQSFKKDLVRVSSHHMREIQRQLSFWRDLNYLRDIQKSFLSGYARQYQGLEVKTDHCQWSDESVIWPRKIFCSRSLIFWILRHGLTIFLWNILIHIVSTFKSSKSS